MKKLKSTVILIFCSLLFTCCGMIPVETAPAKPTLLVGMTPTIESLSETELTQTKGGIRITVSPVLYATEVRMKESQRQVAPPLLSLAPKGASGYYEIVTRPEIVTSPDKLIFRITINNLLPRVFRGEGAIVQFTMGGKVLSVGAESYSELSQVIIAPRQQSEFQIYGPELSSMPNPTQPKTTLGILIYDVVTKVDKAGNITEKQNFEWFFNYSTEKQEVSGPPTRVAHVWK